MASPPSPSHFPFPIPLKHKQWGLSMAPIISHGSSLIYTIPLKQKQVLAPARVRKVEIKKISKITTNDGEDILFQSWNLVLKVENYAIFILELRIMFVIVILGILFGRICNWVCFMEFG